MYRTSQELQKKAAALNFPETMRYVLDYLQDGATESEKKIIVSALMEGVRLIRKAAKQEAEQGLLIAPAVATVLFGVTVLSAGSARDVGDLSWQGQ